MEIKNIVAQPSKLGLVSPSETSQYASAFARLGGKTKSEARAAASRANGKRGGALRRKRLRDYQKGSVEKRLYNVWCGMVARCNNPKRDSYDYYGGRGIRVCERWRQFDNFLQDMRPTWKDGLWLERKDSDGNYDPNNCCWATRNELMRNKRNNRKVTIGKLQYLVSDVSRDFGGSEGLIRSRLKDGWTIEDAIRIPARHKLYNYQGEWLTGREIARRNKFYPLYIIDNRLRDGWSIERALSTPTKSYAR